MLVWNSWQPSYHSLLGAEISVSFVILLTKPILIISIGSDLQHE